MSKKHLRDIALIILVVFATTIVVYPLLFGTDERPSNGAPVELELNK